MHSPNRNSDANQSGFTLIELMIVIVVISVLAAIALPSYQSSLQRARRADAKVGLTQAAQFLERAYSSYNCYNVDVTATTPACGATSATVTTSLGTLRNAPTTGSANYTIQVSAVASGSYTLTATRTGKQASDTCGNFTLDNTGVQGLSSNGSSSTVQTCWQQ